MGSLCSFPFGTLRITEANINEAIRSCDVDFSVAPVSHTRGGSRAGYARWNAFLASGLGSYNRTRNDPLKQHSNGVSRMSAFLNLGRLRVCTVSVAVPVAACTQLHATGHALLFNRD